MRDLLDPFSLLVVSIAGWMNQHQQHWKLGKFAGIDVYLHATFILLLVWIASMHWMAGHNLETMPAGIAFMLALFGSVLLHEFGHALTAKAFGIGTRDITLLPIGGISRIEKMPEKPRQELAVALAGPAVNVVIAAVLFVFLGATNAWVPLDKLALTRGSLIERVLLANISLLFFNLLPAFPIVHTENRVSDCFGIDEWKALARAARSTIRLRLKFSTRTLRFFRPIGLETILPTHSKNLQLKLIRRRARSDGAAHRLQETR
jgi:Peptidase family M50